MEGHSISIVASSTWLCSFATSCNVYSAFCSLFPHLFQLLIKFSLAIFHFLSREEQKRDKNLNYFVATWLPLRGSLIHTPSHTLFFCFSLFSPPSYFTLIFAHNDLICFSIGVAIEALDAWLSLSLSFCVSGSPKQTPKMHTHTGERYPFKYVCVCVFAFSSADIVCQLDIRHIIN